MLVRQLLFEIGISAGSKPGKIIQIVKSDISDLVFIIVLNGTFQLEAFISFAVL